MLIQALGISSLALAEKAEKRAGDITAVLRVVFSLR